MAVTTVPDQGTSAPCALSLRTLDEALAPVSVGFLCLLPAPPSRMSTDWIASAIRDAYERALGYEVGSSDEPRGAASAAACEGAAGAVAPEGAVPATPSEDDFVLPGLNTDQLTRAISELLGKKAVEAKPADKDLVEAVLGELGIYVDERLFDFGGLHRAGGTLVIPGLMQDSSFEGATEELEKYKCYRELVRLCRVLRAADAFRASYADIRAVACAVQNAGTVAAQDVCVSLELPRSVLTAAEYPTPQDCFTDEALAHDRAFFTNLFSVERGTAASLAERAERKAEHAATHAHRLGFGPEGRTPFDAYDFRDDVKALLDGCGLVRRGRRAGTADVRIGTLEPGEVRVFPCYLLFKGSCERIAYRITCGDGSDVVHGSLAVAPDVTDRSNTARAVR